METLQHQLIPILNKATGLIELIDPISGNVIRVQKSRERILEESELVQIQLPDGRTIWAEKNVNLDQIPGIKVAWAFSEVIAGLICQEVASGKTLKTVCELPNFPPYSIVCVWRRAKPAFAKMLLDAKRDWAEAQHDEAFKIIDDVSEDQDAINKAKARVGLRQWAAERAAPETYGTKNEKAGVGNTIIMINTGIQRPGDPGFREVTPNGQSKNEIESGATHNSAGQLTGGCTEPSGAAGT